MVLKRPTISNLFSWLNLKWQQSTWTSDFSCIGSAMWLAGLVFIEQVAVRIEIALQGCHRSRWEHER